MPEGGPCTSDGTGCTRDACNNGRCVGSARPDDSACSDSNSCTTGDHCVSGTCITAPVVCPACESCSTTLGCVPTVVNDCARAASDALIMRRLGSDSMSWRWINGDAVPDDTLGDPTGATAYDLCVYDSAADENGTPRVVMHAAAPAGSDWHPTEHGFSFDRADLEPDGLRRVLLRGGRAAQSRMAAKGVGPGLALPQLGSLVYPLRVQLSARDSGGERCSASRFQRPVIGNSLLLKATHKVRQPDRRPKILLISLDDTRADGFHRMPSVLSRLAARGVSFSNAFVVNPLCAPSRASLLIGLYARGHGVRALGGDIDGAPQFRMRRSDQQTIATWLQSAGYITGLFGKYINGYGFGGEATAGPHGTYYVPPGWSRWRGVRSPEHFGGIQGGSYTLVDERGIATLYDDHVTDRQYSTGVLAGEARRFIADAAQQNRPFFAVWAPYASHAETGSFIPEPAARHDGFFRDLPPWRPPSWGEADVTDKPRAVPDSTRSCVADARPALQNPKTIDRGDELLFA